MTENIPSIEWFTRRLSATPSDFLNKPVMRSNRTKKGIIDAAAVVSDLLFHISGQYLLPNKVFLYQPEENSENLNYIHCVLISSYFFYDSFFQNHENYSEPIQLFFETQLKKTSKAVSAHLFVTDPERREELARLCLNALGLVPQGETKIQFQDRLTTLDSVERARLIEQTRLAQERARLLREEIARKEAEEAASKMSRE